MCYGMNHEDIKLSEVNQYKKHILHDSTWDAEHSQIPGDRR
jgi:hypothetical protein